MMTSFGNVYTWGESQGGGLAVERVVAAIERQCRISVLRRCSVEELTFAGYSSGISKWQMHFGSIIEPFMLGDPYGYACNSRGQRRDVVEEYLCAVSPAFGSVECVTFAATPLQTTVFVNGQERCTITEYIEEKRCKGVWQRLRALFVGSWTFVVRRKGLVCTVWRRDYYNVSETIDVIATNGDSVIVPVSSRAAERRIRDVACPVEFDLLADPGACAFMDAISVVGVSVWLRLARFQLDFSGA